MSVALPAYRVAGQLVEWHARGDVGGDAERWVL